jgi:hypothetical protein
MKEVFPVVHVYSPSASDADVLIKMQLYEHLENILVKVLLNKISENVLL